MRGSGWIPFGAGLLFFVAAVGYPLAAAIAIAADSHDTEAAIEQQPDRQPLWSITVTTAAWAAAVIPGAMVVAWWPGRLLSRQRSRAGFIVCGTLCLIPLCLPDYLLYWCAWQAWPIDSAIHRWAVEADQVATLRGVTLWVGLVAWSWPIAGWFIAASELRSHQRELLALDTRSWLWRAVMNLRRAAPELAVASIIIFTFVFNNTTSFDLAQTRTLGYELRAMMAEGFEARDVLRASWPGAAVVMAAACVVLAMIGRRSAEAAIVAPMDGRGGGRTASIVGMVILLAGVTLPLALAWRHAVDAAATRELMAGYGRAAGNTAMVSTAAGMAAAIVAIGFAVAFADRRKWVRGLAGIVALVWVISGAVPAVAVAAALEGAYNTPFPAAIAQEVANFPPRFDEGIYRTAGIMFLGYLARFGFVAVLLGWWLARAEERDVLAMREIDGGTTLGGLWRTWRPRWIAAGAAALAVVAVLSLGEVSVTALIQPPGFDAISGILLNNMHYQRDDMVFLMARILIVLSAAAALVIMIMATLVMQGRGALRVASKPAAVAVVVAALICGCGDSDNNDSSADAIARISFGQAGRSLGQFVYPRAMDVDPVRGFMYIVDRSGRVQRFGLDGAPHRQWLLPAFENGYPTGITVAADGRVFIADTHESCISVFDEHGNLLEQCGEYGTGPGQFIFPSDIVFGPGGRIYVSEFGENDRVQVFDCEWNYLMEFGGFGSGPGQFNRPQSMCFSADMAELFVADACNHRVQVFDPDGNLLRNIGSAGTEPGEFRYPYGVVMLDDDTIAVTEFGNHRVQILDRAGRSLHVLGRAGEGEGELLAPWTSAVVGDDLYVLDSRNSRVQVLGLPR